jgi:GT2 family glycosyltransferase
VYRADAIEKLGQPFDNRVESYYDDKHLGLRLWSAGYKLLYVPLVVAYHLGSASYAARRKLRSPQWFKGVMLAELAPSYLMRHSSFLLLAVTFGTLSVFLSLFLMVNIIKSFIVVCKELRMFKNNNIFVDRNKIPMLNFILKLDRLKYGITFKRLS